MKTTRVTNVWVRLTLLALAMAALVGCGTSEDDGYMDKAPPLKNTARARQTPADAPPGKSAPEKRERQN